MKTKTLFNDTLACKDLFENANDLIQSVDENGHFLYVNKKWRDVLGYTDEEALRMAFPDIIHQDHLQACFALFAEMKKGKSLDNVRTQFVAKNGRVMDVSGNISVRVKNGKLVSTWGIFREIITYTEVEDILRREQKFAQALIDSLPSVFYVFEIPSFRLVRWNRSLVDVFGFTNEETAKMSPFDFIDRQDKAKIERLIKEIITRGKAADEAFVRAKDGRLIPYFFSAVSTDIADKRYIVGIGIDVTELRKREEELAQVKASLRVRDEQLAKEHELNRAKSEFVSLVSHQLKTPLTIIRWYIEMLGAGYAGGSVAKKKKYFEKIYNNAERMVELVDAFLNVSRLELGVFIVQEEPVNLRDKMELILNNFAPKIKEKRLKITRTYSTRRSKHGARQTPSDFEYIADVKMIQIIFENLVSNAIKYTPPRGKIQIKMQKKGNEILIGVVDTGIGIPANQQSKIFSKFFRADNAASYKTDGTGLGLYVVKSMVDKIGGKIWFQSPVVINKKGEPSGKKEQRGTAFYVAFY